MPGSSASASGTEAAALPPGDAPAYHPTVKTGRLLKFRGPGREVQAYLYRDGDRYHAAIYVDTGQRGGEPVRTLTGSSEEEVETSVRSWVSQTYPEAR